MFTGIIEQVGRVAEVKSQGSNRSFWIESALAGELRPDQSLSHNGVCLTIEETRAGFHRVTAIAETLEKTNLGDWTPGTRVNLERCLQLNGRLDGHFVQGHVDCTATCLDRQDRQGSWEFSFAFPSRFAALIIEKGSVTVNGISLTAFGVKKKKFKVAIIPYTYEHTNIAQVNPGDRVNIEFDLIGKYLQRKLTME